jgi:hypothetical protein
MAQVWGDRQCLWFFIEAAAVRIGGRAVDVVTRDTGDEFAGIVALEGRLLGDFLA